MRTITRVAWGAALFVIALPLYGIDQTVTIRALTTFYSTPLTEWHWGALTEAVLDLRAERNPVVRAHLQIEATASSSGLPLSSDALPLLCSGERAPGRLCLDIPRAYIRMRIPLTEDYRIRFTLGRARLTWGQGQLFNAGDLLFGSSTNQVDYTQDTLRDETALLIASFIPITDRTFVEIVALPPLNVFTDVPIDQGAAGVRLKGNIVDLNYEVAYLYNGDRRAHNIALTLQGNLGIDMYLSTTSAVIHDVSDILDSFYKLLQITFGLYHVIDLGNGLSLSLRLESLVKPAAEWEEQNSSSVEYGLLLYPELSLSISNAIQVFLRTLFSPIDLSAQLITGVSWTPYSGLSLFLYPIFNIGEETSDTFHFDQRGGIQFTLGAQYAF